MRFFLLFSVLLLSSCALVVMKNNYSPVETSYFRVGFNHKLADNNQVFELLDSSNLSEISIQLIREKDDEIYSYWVSVDTIHEDLANERFYVPLKIINTEGRIERFVDGWLNVKEKEAFDINRYTIKETEKGNVVFCFDEKEYLLIHLADELGLHHKDIVKPSNLNKKACLSSQFWGSDFDYRWIELYEENNDFYKFYKYSYGGDLWDSLFVKIPEVLKNKGLSPNYYVEADYDFVTIYNEGEKYRIKTEKYPFNGYGVDKEIDFVSSIFHSLIKDNYFHQTLMQVLDDKHSIDFLRSEDYLITLNNTIKSIGYNHFMSLEEYNKPQVRLTPYGMDYISYLEYGMSLAQFSDSLLYYSNVKSENKYYNEFWARRKGEGTKAAVITILNEIKMFYAGNEIPLNENVINDTLHTLLNYDVSFREEESKDKVLSNYYDYLMGLGLNQSAYNLIFVSDETKGVVINRDSIYENLLIKDKFYQVKDKKMFLSKEESVWVSNLEEY